MRASVVSAAFAAIGSVSALPQEVPNSKIVPALPLDVFNTPRVVYPVPFVAAHEKFESANVTGAQGPDLLGVADAINHVVEDLNRVGGDISRLIGSDVLHLRSVPEDGENAARVEKRATCSNVRVRTEWDSYSNARRQGFVNAIKCLMSRRPNGQFRNSRSRYEDLVALHQQLTPNIHGNAKFLVWHRYFVWTFEDMLRTECGFNDAMPWFDETRYAGRFQQSSIFSNEWFGSANVGGRCVTNGVSTWSIRCPIAKTLT
ncbi:hypothetical protein LEMA_P070650.1 [Plenodomus lingam JN3]|uniref:Tyrosinase copper-binding domain-containing protein n=1 Tax=Leptosphaeria maculans (strain JN3 / isolate v23.1.3 / race Av1-4-5-6-7-8) TaxID=985895 RepID=E4ZJC6_LEPMJ|nr:hypothetical protein LEMA_P070650.1 [Plenodomus lingam JN3]CBX91557.1 hypothetical protein LEMA_P070650.1 [Plenodomus lingam JN3]